MEHKFWHNRWQNNEIGFHEPEGNQLLKQYFDTFNIEAGSTVLVPLCGKTKDIAWLLSRECKVVGIELNEQAIQQLFNELGELPQVEVLGDFKRYYVRNLSVFVGDFFNTSSELIGKVDLVFDRAALVALPSTMREQYYQHLVNITATAPQLLICFQYDQSLLEGPPFNVGEQEVIAYYDKHYTIARLYKGPVEGGVRELKEAYEAVYQLTPSN